MGKNSSLGLHETALPGKATISWNALSLHQQNDTPNLLADDPEIGLISNEAL